jgi:hypothetical protein
MGRHENAGARGAGGRIDREREAPRHWPRAGQGKRTVVAAVAPLQA